MCREFDTNVTTITTSNSSFIVAYMDRLSEASLSHYMRRTCKSVKHEVSTMWHTLCDLYIFLRGVVYL